MDPKKRIAKSLIQELLDKKKLNREVPARFMARKDRQVTYVVK
jgi:hypothetical protein